MAANSINFSFPPPVATGDASDLRSHVAHSNLSQSSYMDIFEDLIDFNEEEYQAHFHSPSTQEADSLTAHDIELYPTTHGQSIPLTSSLPTSNIDSLSSDSIQRRYPIQVGICLIWMYGM